MNQPVSVLVDASNWMFYKSGIFSNCSGNALNLAVLLVGMTDNNWKVKNQWGTSWGEQGYIRLAMGNCCSICTNGSVPLR
jgi:C1A family cysteine protease